MAFVVAGVGYLGAPLVEELLAAGEEVVGLENFFSSDREALARLANHPRFQLVEGSIVDAPAVEEALAVARPVEAVFLLAAQSSAHPQAATPEYTESTNLTGPRVVLDAVVRRGVGTLVYASSLRVYGDSAAGVGGEDTPYGSFRDLAHLSKVYVEKLLEMYSRLHGLRCLALRLGVAYGLSPVMKQDYRFMTAPNKFCRQASRGEALTVYGAGESPQAWIHAADAARALLAAHRHTGFSGYVPLNAAWEVASVRQVAEMVAAAAARRGLEVQVLPPTAAGPAPTPGAVRSRLDRTGFAPSRTLAQGIEESLSYFLEHRGSPACT